MRMMSEGIVNTVGQRVGLKRRCDIYKLLFLSVKGVNSRPLLPRIIYSITAPLKILPCQFYPIQAEALSDQ